MSEPQAVAQSLEEVVPGVLHWRISDERIGGATSSAHAVRAGDGFVLIDPLPLANREQARLEPVQAIVLTAATHQRSAWRLRERYGAPVHLPEGARATAEEPDARYGADAALPGGLRAVHTPGPELPHYSLLLDGEPGVLFCSDLVGVFGRRGLDFVAPEYHEDPEETRRSVERLLELPFDVLCLDHGPPILDDPRARLRELLSR